MPSTPLICCSSGPATVSAITFGFAPGYAVRTTTVGGTTLGYSLIGNWKRASPPPATISSERTAAKIGRSMKNREKFMASSLGAVGCRTHWCRRYRFLHRDHRDNDRFDLR